MAFQSIKKKDLDKYFYFSFNLQSAKKYGIHQALLLSVLKLLKEDALERKTTTRDDFFVVNRGQLIDLTALKDEELTNALYLLYRHDTLDFKHESVWNAQNDFLIKLYV